MKAKTIKDKGNRFGLCKPGRVFICNANNEYLTQKQKPQLEKCVQESTEEMRENDEQVTCFLKLAGIMLQKQIVLNGFRIYAQKTISFM